MLSFYDLLGKPGIEDANPVLEWADQVAKRMTEIAEADDADGGACKAEGVRIALQPIALDAKAKIAIRNVRRDGMEALKEDEKKKEISEDERKRSEEDVQKLTDKFVADADKAAEAKEKEILSQ